MIRQAAARLRVVTLAAGRTPSIGGAEDGRPWQRQIAVLQHYGFRSTLPAQAQVVTVPLGGSPLQEVAIASELPSAGPAPATGDVVVYCQDGNTVTVQANGATVKIDGGGDVVVNGGTAKVARVGDAVGYLVITYAPIPPGGTVAVTAVAWSATIPGGAVTPPVPGTPGVYYQPITITAGAPHFKA